VNPRIAVCTVMLAALAACSSGSQPDRAQAITAVPRPAAAARLPAQCAQAVKLGEQIAPGAASASSGTGYPTVRTMKRWHRELGRLNVATSAPKAVAAGGQATDWLNAISADVVDADFALLPAIEPAGLSGPPGEPASAVPWRKVMAAARNLEVACR
jgi:hypothetical protein